MNNYNLNVDWKKYISKNNKQFLEFVKNNNDFYLNLTNNLIYSHKKNIPFITLFKFKKSNIRCTVYLNEYLLILKQIKEVSQFLEMYEICGIIQNYFRVVTFHNKKSIINADKQYREKTTER